MCIIYFEFVLNIYLFIILYLSLDIILNFIVQMHSILNEMKDIYAKAKICPFSNRLASYCELSLEPGIICYL